MQGQLDKIHKFQIKVVKCKKKQTKKQCFSNVSKDGWGNEEIKAIVKKCETVTSLNGAVKEDTNLLIFSRSKWWSRWSQLVR